MEPDHDRTVRAYESSAVRYAASTEPDPDAPLSEHLRRLVAALPLGATVLEIGSGPGWEADRLEAHGLRVRRTDVTAAFRDLQRRRGARVDHLDVITDDLGGPYDAVMAMCVLQHLDRSLVPAVLAKVAAAVRPGGAFLASLREGRGDLQEGEYFTALWEDGPFSAHLAAVGLDTTWADRTVEPEGDWLTVVAVRR